MSETPAPAPAPKPQKQPQNAISPARAVDFPEWYQAVITAADMAENSDVRGCMVIKPWGYGIWELMQSHLDKILIGIALVSMLPMAIGIAKEVLSSRKASS